MYGRKITPNLREGTPNHLYLPGAHAGVWNEEAVAVPKEIILCESLIDALSFWSAGFRNVTASYGVNGFTAYHRAAFEKHGTERVYLAYDRVIEMDIEPEPEPEPIIEPVPAVIEAAAKEETIEEESILAKIDAQIESQVKAAEPIEEESEPAPAASPIEIKKDVPLLAAMPEPVAPMEPAAAPAPTIDVPVEIRGEDIFLTQGDRRYRVRGLNKNMSYELLKVNVLVCGHTPRGESAFHVDTLDLYSARQRGVYMKQAAEELGIKEEVIRRDLGRLLLTLEDLQDDQIKQALAPKEDAVTISDEDRAAAMELLYDPRLLERIVEDFARCGVVGEDTNKLVGYLGVVSRHLDAPLAVIVQSSSAAGKSSLMEAVLAFLPEEQRVQYSRDDGPVALLHGRNRLEAQGARHRRRRGSALGFVCVEAVAVGGRVDHRQHRQRPGDRPLADASVPRRRAGDDLLNHDGDPLGRRAVEPLPRPLRQ